eukprot:g78795.t1
MQARARTESRHLQETVKRTDPGKKALLFDPDIANDKNFVWPKPASTTWPLYSLWSHGKVPAPGNQLEHRYCLYDADGHYFDFQLPCKRTDVFMVHYTSKSQKRVKDKSTGKKTRAFRPLMYWDFKKYIRMDFTSSVLATHPAWWMDVGVHPDDEGLVLSDDVDEGKPWRMTLRTNQSTIHTGRTCQKMLRRSRTAMPPLKKLPRRAQWMHDQLYALHFPGDSMATFIHCQIREHLSMVPAGVPIVCLIGISNR